MKLAKRLSAFFLAFSMILGVSISASAFSNTNADLLKGLGLFRGTKDGSYALEETATRMQGLIMLTRLLGEEETALSSVYPCPFTDVSPNMKPYVAYAYHQGYTTGTSNDESNPTFSPARKIGFKHYVTFLLRALGYNDQAGDFSFGTSLDKAAEIGMIDSSCLPVISRNDCTFYRGDLVDLSAAALVTKLADGSMTLAEKLAQQPGGPLSDNGEKLQRIMDANIQPYTRKTAEKPIAPQPPVAPVKPAQPEKPQPPVAPEKPAATSSITRKTATYKVPSGAVTADVFTVDLSDPKVEVRAAMVGNTLGKTAAFKDIVDGSSAQVVVNGNFFESNKAYKIPIGHVMVDGTFLYGNTGLSSIAFTDDGKVMIGRPSLFFFVEGGGQSWACYEVNTAGQAADTSVLYNSGYGSSVTLTCDGVITTVINGVIQSSAPMAAGSVAPIPANGFVMFFGNAFASTDYYRTPVIGNSVSIEPRLMKDEGNGFSMNGVTGMLSGAPRLVENGAICTTLEPGFQEARFTTVVGPRTAVGKLANGKLIILSTSKASVQQLREVMLQLGCVDAINLDGGASTALAYQGKVIRNPGRQLTTTLQIFVH